MYANRRRGQGRREAGDEPEERVTAAPPGFHSAAAFIAMAMLCVGGFKPALPQL